MRRKINRRMTKLRSDLRDFAKARSLKTKDRERHNVPTVALVGYTNAGKSTLLKPAHRRARPGRRPGGVPGREQLPMGTP